MTLTVVIIISFSVEFPSVDFIKMSISHITNHVNSM